MLCIFRTRFACRGSFSNRRSDPKSWNSIRMTLHKIMHLNHNFWHLSTKNFHSVTLKKSESVPFSKKLNSIFFHQNWWWPFLNAKPLDSFLDLLPNCVASKRLFIKPAFFKFVRISITSLSISGLTIIWQFSWSLANCIITK